MLEQGVMVLPRGWWFLSTAHTDDDVAETVQAAERAFAEVGATRSFA
jgi:glutamate-1-semialdehyde 2,1-aminomutase